MNITCIWLLEARAKTFIPEFNNLSYYLEQPRTPKKEPGYEAAFGVELWTGATCGL